MNTIPLFKVFMAETASQEVAKVLNSWYIGEGPKVAEFEKQLANYSNNQNAVLVNSGTSALHLAYHLAIYDETRTNEVNQDAEIITSSITCTATNTPIMNHGAKIVWADADPISGNISPESIRKNITKNTKAIIMIHWGGNPCEIDEINKIAKEYGIKTVEDGAHSIGTEWNGRRIGNDSDYTMHSFQAIKHLTSIDGGVLFCKNEKDAQRAKLLRWFGIDRNPQTKEKIDLRCELDVAEAGYKFHMNDVSATVGIENLKHIDWIVSKHQENALFYDNAFKGIDKIKVSYQNPKGKSAYWLYTIHINNRNELMEKMTEIGVATSKVHSRNDLHSMFSKFDASHLRGADQFNNTHLCIPVGWWVTKENREFIAENIIKFAK